MSPPEREQRGKTVPCYAEHTQKVEIHWRMPNGKIVVQSVPCPQEPLNLSHMTKPGPPDAG